MNLDEITVVTLDGTATSLARWHDDVKLIVNVASRCGFTPQYRALEALQQRYGGQGFTVLGFPSNQFHQELSSPEKIAEFCSTTYGVTFPMFETIKVNGRGRHPLYDELTQVPDDNGKAGRVAWNFEKFLVMPSGQVRRFRSRTEPDDPRIVALIEAALPVA
jgi:glutathione peroxidase